jgi:Tfp pilus assembly protein PilZ
MRQYIRHLLDIPIEVRYDPDNDFELQTTQNVSYGGLLFHSEKPIELGSIISLRILYLEPAFEVTEAQVAWCQKSGSKYLIGVEFPDPEDAFRVRIVEQLCQIESYKKEIELKESRRLTTEEAAKEWISRYAASFPNP